MGNAPWYCTREDVKAAIDSAETARNNARIDRACNAATDAINQLTYRRFYPYIGTFYFDYREIENDRLYVGDFTTLTALTVAGESISTSDVLSYPANTAAEGRPFTWIELDTSSSAGWDSGDTGQNAIAMTAVWGFTADTESVALTAEALDASETGVDVTDSSSIGIGDLIKVDSEYMIVTGKSLLTTAQTLQTPMTASSANTSCAVTNGALYFAGEVITLDAERMLVEDVAGDTLVVKRAIDGSTLATHTGSTIYAPRTLVVERGAVGSTAATHLTAAPTYRHRVPYLVKTLAIGEALNVLLSEESAWARTPGEGVSARPASGAGLQSLRDQVHEDFGIRFRMGAV